MYRQSQEPQRSSASGYYNEMNQQSQGRAKKKELQKIQSGPHSNQYLIQGSSQENLHQIKGSIPGARVKSQASNGHPSSGGQVNDFSQIHDGGQGVSNIKNVAIKGATGRKGSLPLSYAPSQGQIFHNKHSNQSAYNPSNAAVQNRQSQQYLPTNNRVSELSQNQLGTGKIIKSHAKYFSQQNSPVMKDGTPIYQHHHQQSLGTTPSGIILSTSGAGIIGIDNHPSGSNGRMNNDIIQNSHQTTGNFGSANSGNNNQNSINRLQQSERIYKNSSQVSQHSNNSLNMYQQSKQQQQQNYGGPSNQAVPMRYTNSNEFDQRRVSSDVGLYPNQVQKAVVGGLGPILSNAAQNQTVASANTLQSQSITQSLSNQTIQQNNASSKQKLKLKYDESFLNGPLITNDRDEIKSKNKQLMQQQQLNAKRILNNQSVNVGINLDEPILPVQPTHKRVLSSQQNFAPPGAVQRANTSSGNYQVQVPQQYHQQQKMSQPGAPQQQMNKTEYNQFKSKAGQKTQKFVQANQKSAMEKSQELFNKSGNQLSFLNPTNIVLNAQGERVGVKNMKRPAKAQTRPASNQKVKQLTPNDNLQMGRFDVNSQIGSQQNKKTKNGVNTVIQDRRSTGQYQRASPNITAHGGSLGGKYNNIQNYYPQEQTNAGTSNQHSAANLVHGGQSIQYYGNKTPQHELQTHNSQTGMPMLQSSSIQNIANLNSHILNQQQITQMQHIASSNPTFDKKGKQIVPSAPNTMHHKSSKAQGNNYMKQNTIQNEQLQYAEYIHSQAAANMHQKRLSTGNIVPSNNFSHGENQDPLSFSMKKQSFHQRAETQLKNFPTNSQYQGYDPMLMREQEAMVHGTNSQGSFLVLPNQHGPNAVLSSGQGNVKSSKLSQMNMNPNLKYSNSKSQKSSTSRLINSSSTQGRYAQAQTKASGQPNASSSNAGSTDRVPISQRHMQMMNNESNNQNQNSDNNYGGQGQKNAVLGAATSSGKSSLKSKTGSKLNTLQHGGGNTSYPYQSSSTKSGKTTSQAHKNSNLSIAQIFQQKGLNYKGPSKVMITQNNSGKMAHKMGPNGVIVHTKGIGLKGSLTTSANTAQNSPRLHNKGSMFNKNQNMSSLRRKPSTASIAGASIGGGQSSSSNFAVQGALQNDPKKLSSSASGKMNRQDQQAANISHMRSTSGGNSFKKTPKVLPKTKKNEVIQYRGNMNHDDHAQYQEDVQVTEIAAYDGQDKMNQLEPSKMGNYSKHSLHRNQNQQYSNTNSRKIDEEDMILNDHSDENINLLESEKAANRKMKGKQNQYQHQAKQLSLGPQQSSQYIADNGGTGSNPSHQNQKGISQQDFYTHNILNGGVSSIPSNIPQKKNQHSHSLGQIQQFHQNNNEPHIENLGLRRPSNLIMQQSKKPTVDKQKKGSSQHSQSSNQMLQNKVHQKGQNILAKQIGHKKNEKSINDGAEQFVYKDDEIEYRRQLEEVLNDDDYEVAGPMITEEEEQEIRQVASDINEKAFYGKVLRAKQIIQDPSAQNKEDKQFQKLSPRSQEIASVMKKIDVSFRKTKSAPETEITMYRIGKMLGRGAFGKVNLAMHKLVRKLVALKSLNKECLTDEVQKQKLMKEVNLLLKLRHDHVVKIYETIETKKHIIIVMELCAGGDLLNYVRKRRRLKEPFAKKIFKQLIDGLSYIHSKHVGHRDIKLDNILLDGKGSVKIGDFGVSKQCQPGVKMREQCGTPAYIAPEILKNKNGYGFGVDLWSAGVVLFAMLYGTVPFKAASMEELHSLILRGVYTLKEDISTEARDMLRGLLEINPHKRLTVEEILKHPWLEDYDESLQLFNDQEREMIKKEYTYNDPSRYNRNENEEPVDCFTEHNIDSVYNTMKNASEKSIILAPFNSTQSEDFEQFKKDIKHMMCEKNLVLRLSRLCREIDRQYEFNNNGQLDNGVYHKQLNNTQENKSDGGEGDDLKKKEKKKDGSDDDEDESRFQIMQCSRSQGIEFLTEDFVDLKKQNAKSRDAFVNHLIAGMQEEERKLIESTFGTNKEMEIDTDKVEQLLHFGYPEKYVYEALQDSQANYVTAGYYLLQMDQNYC